MITAREQEDSSSPFAAVLSQVTKETQPTYIYTVLGKEKGVMKNDHSDANKARYPQLGGTNTKQSFTCPQGQVSIPGRDGLCKKLVNCCNGKKKSA